MLCEYESLCADTTDDRKDNATDALCALGVSVDNGSCELARRDFNHDSKALAATRF
jgi:hypothetical protein